jgi:hypothetical protein
MPKQGRASDADLRERSVDQVRLGLIGPNGAAWPIAVTKSGTVKYDDPVLFRREIDEAAGQEILDHAAIAMEQDQWLSFPPHNIMEPDPVHLDEFSDWGIVPLSLIGAPLV